MTMGLKLRHLAEHNIAYVFVIAVLFSTPAHAVEDSFENTCLESFTLKHGSSDPTFKQSVLKPINHAFSKTAHEYDVQKVKNFNISLDKFAGFPLYHLLVKPGHILARDHRYMQSIKNRLLEGDKTIELSGTEPIELVIYHDSAGLIERIEVDGGHHRMIGIYGYLKEIGAPMTLASVLQLDQNAFDIRHQNKESDHPISKVPLHGVSLAQYKGEVTDYKSLKVPTIKVHASNYVAGSRTPLGSAAKFSLRMRNQKKRVAFYIIDKDTQLSHQELQEFLQKLNHKASTHRYREIMLVSLNKDLKQRISRHLPHANLNLYTEDLELDFRYVESQGNDDQYRFLGILGNGDQYPKFVELRLQQIYQTYNVLNISRFPLK